MPVSTTRHRYILPAILLLTILLVAGWQRATLLEAHFGHVDDLGVALSITEAQAQPMNSAFLLAQARDKEQAGRGTERTKTLRRLLGNSAARTAVDTLAPLYPFAAVPLVWTYAPLPFLVTPLLIGPNQDYATIKWRGRLPSLIFALAAIAMAAVAGWRIVGPVGVAAAIPLAFSREFTVMSVQMHSYAATVFTAAALVWLTVHDAGRADVDSRRSVRFIVVRGAVLVAACYLSYQSILLVPGYLSALMIARLRERASGSGSLFSQAALRRLLMPATLAAIFAIAILPAWFFRLRSIPAVNWNAGPHREFLFHPATLGEAVTTLPGFLAANGWLSATALLSPVAPDGIAGELLSGIWLLLALAGLAIAMMQGRRRPALLAIAVYATATFGIILLFVVTGRLTLSPTRHLLIVLPLVAVLGAIGLAGIGQLIGRPASGVAAAIITLAFGGSAMIALPTFARQRGDHFSEARVAALVRAARPDLVLGYDWTVQPMLMPSVRRRVPVALADPVGIARPLILPARARILLLSHRGPLTETACRTIFARLERPVPRPCLAGLPMIRLATDAVTAPEVEASPYTRGGGNGFFATLIRVPVQPSLQKSSAKP